MSRRLFSRSDDLRRLQSDGYTLEVVGGNLVVRDVPFVDGARQVHDDGFLVMALELAGDVTAQPTAHTADFGGGIPCTAAGTALTTVVNGQGRRDLGHGIIVDCSCSMKPFESGGRYKDYYEKVTKYVAALAGQAAKLDQKVTARRHQPIIAEGDDGPFVYLNTASSRAGIDAINAKLSEERVAIIGGGGTASYILDFVAKTEVAAIHLYDDDILLTHNAFRVPGAVSLDDLRAGPRKVDYLAGLYVQLHRGIVAHPYRVDANNVSELQQMTFVFIAIDDAPAKKPIVDALVAYGIAFVDVGMGVEDIDGRLTASLRTTLAAPGYDEHLHDRIAFIDPAGPDEYRSNIQIAELNARNAADAVIAWKKHRGFYCDLGRERHSVYTLATNHIVNLDAVPAPAEQAPKCA